MYVTEARWATVGNEKNNKIYLVTEADYDLNTMYIITIAFYTHTYAHVNTPTRELTHEHTYIIINSVQFLFKWETTATEKAATEIIRDN